MDNVHPGLLIGLLIFLLACSAFFSSSETGILSLNRYRLRHMAKEGHRGAKRVSSLLSRPDRLLGTILIGNNFVNILASSIATVLAIKLYGEAGIAIATIGLTIVLLIFGEITPKTLAALHPEKVAYPASLPLQLLLKVFYPLVILLGWISNGLLRMLGVDPASKSDDALTTEELRSVVRESGHELPKNRQSMLLGILDLERVTVNDIMIPRNEVVGINLQDDLTTIIEQLRTTTHTRLPVFKQDINQVEGIVHMRELTQLLTHDELTIESLLRACSEPYFIPESTPLSTQLFNFQKQKLRIGMVVDEYGDVLGVVTLEDILE
ncbi:HlyC/CorC family transporter, partial [Pseudomonas sp. CrR14]|nr:HlyC/CorC family transporter [Pseudomonas sp. CrR14]